MKPKQQNDFERDVKTYHPVIAQLQSPLDAFEYLFKNASHINEYTLLFLVQERFSLTDAEVWKEYGAYQKKSGKPFGRASAADCEHRSLRGDNYALVCLDCGAMLDDA